MSVIILFFALIAYLVYVAKKGNLPRITLHESPVQIPSYVTFQRTYENRELEERCKRNLYDESKRDGIWDSVSRILSTLDDWKEYSRTDFDKQERTSTGEYFYANERMVIALMMAEYGKMSSVLINGWSDWEMIPWHRHTNENAIKGYQLARWFATVFADYDSGLRLCAETINGRNYAWNKSRRAMIFSKDLTKTVPVYK